MSIGTWEPGQSTETKIDSVFLQRAVELGTAEQWDRLQRDLSEPEQRQHAAIMRLGGEQWEQVLKQFDDQALVALLKFFTVAEMKLPGWEAGERSPVIAIAREMKLRQLPLEKSLLLWIRQHSNNRFLPYGSIG